VRTPWRLGARANSVLAFDFWFDFYEANENQPRMRLWRIFMSNHVRPQSDGAKYGVNVPRSGAQTRAALIRSCSSPRKDQIVREFFVSHKRQTRALPMLFPDDAIGVWPEFFFAGARLAEAYAQWRGNFLLVVLFASTAFGAAPTGWLLRTD